MLQTFRTRWHAGLADAAVHLWFPALCIGVWTFAPQAQTGVARLIAVAGVLFSLWDAVGSIREHRREITVTGAWLEVRSRGATDRVPWDRVTGAEHFFEGEEEGWHIRATGRGAPLRLSLAGFEPEDARAINRLIRAAIPS